MLTNVEIRAFKTAQKPYKRSDGGGLYLLIQPNGLKIWRFAYRFDGKQKLLSGGLYPNVSLFAARGWRDMMKQQVALGLDPSEERRNEREAAGRPSYRRVANSFEPVAREWLALREVIWTPRYSALVTGRLESDIFPVIGKLNIKAVTPRQILDALRRIEQRGAVEMARRLKNHCSEIFRYAIPDGRCSSDPCRDLAPAMSKPRPVRHRAKVAVKDLPDFFVKRDGDGGERLSHLALRWTILTMVRTQETRFAEWSEFENLEGSEALWRIPAERMKMRSEHLVPLSHQALALLEEIRATNPYLKSGSQRYARFLFPVANSRTQTISENRMLDIMYRIGLRGKATVHGFRGLASTVLNESGFFKGDWIEHQLAHQPRGVRAAYNAAEYLLHRRRMMQWWANYLDMAEARGMTGNNKKAAVEMVLTPVARQPALPYLPGASPFQISYTLRTSGTLA